MKLYKIYIKEEYIHKLVEDLNTDDEELDYTFTMLVAAESEVNARLLASKSAGDEGATTWIDSEKSECKRFKPENITEECVIFVE